MNNIIFKKIDFFNLETSPVKFVYVVEGMVNDKAFECVYFEHIGLDSSIEVFSEYWNEITHEEKQSIKRKLKTTNCDDFKSIKKANKHFYFDYIEVFTLKYKGKKIYLDVPRQRKDFARENGAMWDNYVKKWFIYSKHPNKFNLKKYNEKEII